VAILQNLVQRIWGVFHPVSGALLGLTISGETPYFPVNGSFLNFPSVAGVGSIHLVPGTGGVTAASAGCYLTPGDGGGGLYLFNPLDTTSGCFFLGSISGTALTVASVFNGAIAIGQNVYGPNGAAVGRVIAGAGASWTLSGSGSTPGNVNLSADTGGTILTGLDGGRWYLTAGIGSASTPPAPTNAEIAAAITPSNYAFPEIMPRRYGADGTGGAADTTALTTVRSVLAALSMQLLQMNWLGSILHPRTTAETGGGITPTNIWYSPDHIGYDVRRAGATGNGVTDDTAAIAAANTVAASGGAMVYFPPGTYAIGSNLALTAPTLFDRGAILKPAVGVIITLSYQPIAGPWQIFNVTSTPATGAGSVQAGVTPITGSALGDKILGEWFGAIGDGATNSGRPIQAALNFGISCGGTPVQLQVGSYVTQQTLFGCGTPTSGGTTGVRLLGIPSLKGAVRGTLLTDNGAFATVGQPILCYRSSASSDDQNCYPEYIVFDSTTATYTVGLQISGMDHCQPYKCQFGPTALLEGIRWWNMDAGTFSEQAYARSCEFWSGCATVGHFLIASGTFLGNAVAGGNASFRGSGFVDRCQFQVPSGGTAILVDVGASLYNAMLSADVGCNAGTLITNNSALANSCVFRGDLTLESGTNAVTLGGGTSDTYFCGTFTSNGANLTAGKWLRISAWVNNNVLAACVLDARQGGSQALVQGANTLASNEVMRGLPRIMYLQLRYTSGAAYIKWYAVSVYPTGTGSTQVTGLNAAAAPVAMYNIDSAGYGEPSWSGAANGDVIVTNANWPLSTAVTATWYEVQMFPGSVAGQQAFI
jgi:hypothetical protein